MKISHDKFFLYMIIASIGIVAFVMNFSDGELPESMIVFSNVVVAICLFVYVKFRKQIDMSAIMIVFAWIFSVAGLLPEYFEWTETRKIVGVYPQTVVAKAAVFVATSIVMFTLGAMLANDLTSRKRAKKRLMRLRLYVDNSSFMLIAKFFFFIGIIPMAAYILRCLRYVFLSGYGAAIYNDGVISDGSFFISLKNYFLIGVYMLIVGYGAENTRKAKRIMVVGFAYCILMILIGQRLTIIAYFIGLLFCYHYSVENLRKYKKTIILIIVISVLVLPVLSSYRLIARNQWNISGIIEQINLFEGVFSLLEETSGSMLPMINCIGHSGLNSMELHGASYLECFALSIMFSSIVKMFYDPGYSSLQVMYTRMVAPGIARVGGGLGFSMFAEAYINFHEAGVFVLGFFGYFFTRMFISGVERKGSGEKLWLPIALFLCQRLLFYVRSDMKDFYGNFKLMLLIIIICFFVSQITRKKLT